MENKCDKNVILSNVRRVGGQVQGIEKMIEADRDITEVIQQVTAAAQALKSVAKQLLEDYANGCFGRRTQLDKKDLRILIEQLFKNL